MPTTCTICSSRMRAGRCFRRISSLKFDLFQYTFNRVHRRIGCYSDGTMLFEVKGLSKRFGKLQALMDVSFQVQAGEILGLIGPNGAGKSTLFECLAGVLPADSGAVLAAGRPAREHERRSLLFYVPDSIAPWSAQPVGWALDFTIGFFRGRAAIRDEVIEGLDLRQ